MAMYTWYIRIGTTRIALGYWSLQFSFFQLHRSTSTSMIQFVLEMKEHESVTGGSAARSHILSQGAYDDFAKVK